MNEEVILKEIYKANPDFYHRSMADKRKYGRALVRLNRETIKEMVKKGKELQEKQKDEIRQKLEDIIKEESEPIIKGRKYFVF